MYTYTTYKNQVKIYHYDILFCLIVDVLKKDIYNLFNQLITEKSPNQLIKCLDFSNRNPILTKLLFTNECDN